MDRTRYTFVRDDQDAGSTIYHFDNLIDLLFFVREEELTGYLTGYQGALITSFSAGIED